MNRLTCGSDRRRHRASAALSPDQTRLARLTYDVYVRRGARLAAAQKDQLGKIKGFGLRGVHPATYDGDTPQALRADIRRYAGA